VKLYVAHISSTDVKNLPRWKPKSPEEVYFPLHIEIGEKGQVGTYCFQVLVATPEALRKFGEEYETSFDQSTSHCPEVLVEID
jgi:hypothetical protein